MSKSLDRFLDIVDTPEQLPVALRDEFERQPAQPIHRILLCPPQEFPVRRVGWLGDLPFGWRLTPQRVLVFGDYHITVISREASGNPTTINIPLDALLCIELATVLLRAHVRFTWACGSEVETLHVDFNSVGELKMRRELDYVRAVMAERARPAGIISAAASYEHLPLKYRNYLRYSLISDERVAAVVYQPAIRHPRSPLRWYLSPNRAIALTDQHLILIEDERRSPQPDYAVITRFIPLGRIRAVHVEQSGELDWLHVELGFNTVARHDLSIPLVSAEAARLEEALQAARPDLQRFGGPPSVDLATTR